MGDIPIGIGPAEAARLLGVPEGEAERLVGSEGEVRLGAEPTLVLALFGELGRAREEVGRLGGQLGEVRAANARLRKEFRESVEERRRLVGEVLELRAAAEERLMLMERVERIAGIEGDLVEREREIAWLRARGPVARLLNR